MDGFQKSRFVLGVVVIVILAVLTFAIFSNNVSGGNTYLLERINSNLFPLDIILAVIGGIVVVSATVYTVSHAIR